MKTVEKEMLRWFHLGFRHSQLMEFIPPLKGEIQYAPSYLAGQEYHHKNGGPKCFLKDELIIDLCNKSNEHMQNMVSEAINKTQ